jgi:hypothetical protein
MQVVVNRHRAWLSILLLAAGCTVYQPVVVAPSPPSGPSTFDRSWNAALQAAQDSGVYVYSADRTSGVISGNGDGSSVIIKVFTQADGRVRVEFNVTSPTGTDTVLANRLSDAYDRNMGR